MNELAVMLNCLTVAPAIGETLGDVVGDADTEGEGEKEGEADGDTDSEGVAVGVGVGVGLEETFEFLLYTKYPAPKAITTTNKIKNTFFIPHLIRIYSPLRPDNIS